MSSLNKCRKTYLTRYCRELTSLQKMIASELEALKADGANFEVGRSMPGVAQEVARLAEALRLMENIANYED